MNTMLSSVTEVEIRIRNYIESKVSPAMRFAYDFVEGTDLSENAAGILLEQNEDFWMFEINLSDVRRAGPGLNSPRRYWGTLDLSVFTKAPRDKVKYSAALEQVADWLQDDTVDGIRFRSFIPTSTTPIHGFTSYNGVINFEFEIALNRS